MTLGGAYRREVGLLELTGRVGSAGGVRCALAGRIDNRRDLAIGLGLSPAAPAQDVIALAFSRRGEGVLGELRGSWALAAWDERRGAGVLAVDPLGDHSLLFAAIADGIEFGSEPAALSAGSGPPDRRALARWLARHPLPAEVTLIQGVRRLPPGHLLELGANRTPTPRRWWDPVLAEPAPIARGPAARQLRNEMRAAVRRAAGAGEVAVMVSGGFDSLSVLGLLAGDVARPRAYAMAFPQLPEVDETERIAIAARRHDADITVLAYEGGSPLAAAAEYAGAWGLPPASPNGFVWRPLLERARDDGVTALLDGEGGDELFGCSPQLIADHLRALRPAAAVAAARALPGYAPSRDREWVRRALRRYGVRDASPAWAHRLARRLGVARPKPPPPWLSTEALRLLGDDTDLDWKRRGGPRWRAAMLGALVDGPARRGAATELRQAAALRGLERLHPWRDPQLIVHMLALPPELHFDPDRDRPLARDAMAGVLDERLRSNQEKPHFNRVLDAALLTERGRVEGCIRDLPEPLRSLVDGAALAAALPRGGEPQPGWGAALWPLLSAAAWLETTPR